MPSFIGNYPCFLFGFYVRFNEGVIILSKNIPPELIGIGKRIRDKRKRKAIKQNQLAILSGISNTFLSDIENERTIPSLITYVKICQALKIDLNDLINY